MTNPNLSDVERDSVRDALAILRAVEHGDETAVRVILHNSDPFRTVTSLAAFALTMAARAGANIDTWTAAAFADMNRMDTA
jgi:hypothetical protein